MRSLSNAESPRGNDFILQKVAGVGVPGAFSFGSLNSRQT
jgi:hypothetical protein